LERETLTCPFCGAPHRGVIPSGTVQVKCKYCGGTILVPSSAPCCPGHPEVLAVGLCNDCGGSYCDSCLYLAKIKEATLYLCPGCYKKRVATGTTVAFVLLALCLVMGFFLFLVEPPQGVVLLIFTLPLLAWVIYSRFHPPKFDTLKERTEATRRAAESRKAFISQLSTFELYNVLLNDCMRDYGAESGWKVLEREIDSYVQTSMTRSEAIRKIAEEKGLLELQKAKTTHDTSK